MFVTVCMQVFSSKIVFCHFDASCLQQKPD